MLIYSGQVSETLIEANETDKYTISIAPGQTISLLVESADSLQPYVDLLRVDSDGDTSTVTSVGHASAANPGEATLLQTVSTPGRIVNATLQDPTYQIVIGGVSGSAGNYSLQIVLNAAIESELPVGSPNDTLVSAQDLTDSFISLHTANNNGNAPQPRRAAVLGQLTVDAPVVPNANLDLVPNFSGNAFPLILDPFGIPSMRYQQIYAADQFANGGVIDELRFRRALGTDTISNLELDVEIRLSYAATSVLTSSANFAENVGSDVTTVYNGPLTISSSATVVPFDFDAVIDVDDTFVYDPSRGDLLVDFLVRDSNYSFPAYFEATSYPAADDATTRIFAESVDAEWGTVGYRNYEHSPYGLVTQIAFDTPPDPADWYRFKMATGQSATFVLNVLEGRDAQIALMSPAGAPLAVSSQDDAEQNAQVIRNFVATTSGTYYLKVTSEAGVTYSLVVAQDMVVEAERNDSLETAQEVTSPEVAGRRWVSGSLENHAATVNVFDAGWYLGGYHNPGDNNYTTGYLPQYGEFRDFFAFDLSQLPEDAQVTNAVFSVNVRNLVTNDGVETLQLVDVTTPVDQVVAGGSNRNDIFEDLGTGQDYAARDVYTAEALTDINIDLNAYAVADINAALGGTFALGGVVTSIDYEQWWQQQNIFGMSNWWATTPSLELTMTDSDFYEVLVDGNRMLEIQSYTPAGGAGEPANRLDPLLRLYDSAGNLLASNDDGADDGRNALLRYKVPKNAGGRFYIQVASAADAVDAAVGEYFLSIKGATTVVEPFAVTDTMPSEGSRVYKAPQELQVSFNDTVLLPTLQPNDLLLNGVPALAVTPVDGNTVQFRNGLAFQWTPDLGGNNHYYVLTSSALPWLESQAEAVSLGGNLVTVNGQAEQNFLKRVFFSGTEYRSFWIGLNDFAQEGQFEWVSGEPVDYINWSPGQPDNVPPGEDAVQINFDPGTNNGAWNDLWDSVHTWYESDVFGIIELTSLPQGYALAQEGLNTFSLASNSIRDIQSTNLQAYTGSFWLDTTPPVIVTTSPSQDAVVTAGQVSVDVTFSEAMDTTTIYDWNVAAVGQLSGYHYPSSLAWNSDATVLTVVYDDLPEDTFTIEFTGDSYLYHDLGGLHLDGDGDLVEGGTYYLQFTTDAGIRAVPVPLQPVAPRGSLIYETPFAATGTLMPAGDVDEWTISLDANQTVTLQLSAADSVTGSVELLAPDGSSIATASGSDPGRIVLLQTAPISQAGVYTIAVSSINGTGGQYSLELLLNAALEEETVGGHTNNDPASAQSIEGSFVSLANGASRGAVRGDSGNEDFYAFELGTGQELTVAVQLDTATSSSFVRNDYYSYAPAAVALGDVNHDGFQDIVAASAYGNCELLLGTADGTFGEPSTFGYGATPQDVQLADVNGDGNLDAVIANYYGAYDTGSVSVMLGRGDGTFEPAVGYSAGSDNVSVAVGDVTGDGAPDIVTAGYDMVNYVYAIFILPNRNLGDGTFAAPMVYAVGDAPNDVTLADLDGENGLDVITANLYGGYAGESLTLLYNLGDSTFIRSPLFAGYYNSAVAVADLNGDDLPDIATANMYDNQVTIWNNNDAGGFDPSGTYSTAGYDALSLALGDADGDGDRDIITGSYYNESYSGGVVSILLNDAGGVFGDRRTADVGYGPYGLTVGNLNEDDTLDIVAAAFDSSTVSVLLNFPAEQRLTLYAPDGTPLVTSSTGTPEFQLLLANFVAPVPGQYQLSVSSTPSAYSLIVTRGAGISLEENDNFALAQSLNHTQDANGQVILGALVPRLLTVDAFDSGTYDPLGNHDPFNTDYFTGYLPPEWGYLGEYRGFFAFDLSGLSSNETIVGARFQVYTAETYMSQGVETLQLSAVTTPIDELTAGIPERVDIFEDLGDGSVFGARDVWSSEYYSDITIDLNSDAIAALNLAKGQYFALGASVSSIDINGGYQAMFGYSADVNNTRSLLLSVADSDYYQLEALEGHTIVMETSTPSAGPGEFVNDLAPVVRLYNQDGILVATNADSGNAFLEYVVPAGAAGTYYVEIAGGSTVGEYVLSIRQITPLVPAADADGEAVAASTITTDAPAASPWSNRARRQDVSNDGQVTPIDALLLISRLNTNGTHRLPPERAGDSPDPFFDVNGDGFLSPADVLLVIHLLNNGRDDASAAEQVSAVDPTTVTPPTRTPSIGSISNASQTGRLPGSVTTPHYAISQLPGVAPLPNRLDQAVRAQVNSSDDVTVWDDADVDWLTDRLTPEISQLATHLPAHRRTRITPDFRF